ncbi:hypothetical protein AMK14_33885 [Streptomyces sp. TSRI0445]|nr:hypothetical protein AMK14_33885 [Streptomyces sp. TSRI0445]
MTIVERLVPDGLWELFHRVVPVAPVRPKGGGRRRYGDREARVWAKLHRLVLDELGARSELDWSRCAIDSVNMRALKRGT